MFWYWYWYSLVLMSISPVSTVIFPKSETAMRSSLGQIIRWPCYSHTHSLSGWDTQSSYLSRISRIIFVEKKLSCGEISAFYTEFEQFMEFYQSFCRFCSKSMWRKICVEKICAEKKWRRWGLGTLCPPCHVFAYNRANTHDFSQLWVRFLPHKIISFCQKV